MGTPPDRAVEPAPLLPILLLPAHALLQIELHVARNNRLCLLRFLGFSAADIVITNTTQIVISIDYPKYFVTICILIIY